MTDRDRKNDPNIGRIAERPYWMTYVSLVARAVHQVGAALFLAYYLFGENSGTPTAYLILATLSGFLLMAVEAVRHRQLLREISGVTTLFKLVIIGLAFHAWIPAYPAILVAFLLASLVSHAPKKIRHKVIF